jgi:UDP-glucuronate 4-epimerase
VKYLVTGVAGFIGFHVCQRLLAAGETVIGLDSISDYYDTSLKEARLALLAKSEKFNFHRVDIAENDQVMSLIELYGDITHIIHLAAQPGVRYSVTHPFSYTHSNINGHLVMLEVARRLTGCEHFVYASSSSVYGANRELPYSTADRCERPISLYAATKLSCELMSYSYSHLYGIRCTGLRFFTVYGPWGRPDMSVYLFTKAIIEGKPVRLFNHGKMSRDFTYVDDIVSGILRAVAKPPAETPPARVFNIGNHRSEPLSRLIEALEKAVGKKAEIIYDDIQPGDVLDTYADIAPLQQEVGFQPTTTIDEGVPKFVSWYREFYGV